MKRWKNMLLNCFVYEISCLYPWKKRDFNSLKLFVIKRLFLWCITESLKIKRGEIKLAAGEVAGGCCYWQMCMSELNSLQMSCEITEFIRSRNCTHRSWWPWENMQAAVGLQARNYPSFFIQNLWKHSNRFSCSNLKCCFSCLPCFYNRACLYWEEEAIWKRLCPLLATPCMLTQFSLHSAWG